MAETLKIPTGTKPSQLKKPVPNDPDLEALQSIANDPDLIALQSVAAAGPEETAGAPQEGAGQVGYSGFGSDTLETVAYGLPTVGGIAGGIAGNIPGAAFGAVAGTAWKQVILQDVLKRVPQQSVTERLTEQGTEGVISGAGSLAGLGVSKGLSKAVGTKWGQAVFNKIAEKASGPLNSVKEVITREMDEIFEPVERILAQKVTPMTGEEAGQAIKQQLTEDIRGRFAGFAKAYGNLDEIAQSIPLDTVLNKAGKTVRSVRTNFTDKVRNEALDLPQNTYKNVKGYTDRFDQATNGRDFLKVAADLRKEAEKTAADAVKYGGNSLRDRAATLMKFADDAESYYEDKIVGGLAKRVADGKATLPEMEGFQRLMSAQQNPNIPMDPKNLSKYTRSVATDYLEQKEAVKQAYAQFRGLLEDISDVTKVKSQRLGPRQFARALEEVPPDVLAERAFDPKNAGAMLVLEKHYPRAYDTIIKNKMSSIIAKNTSVAGDIDYKAIATTLKDMPESSSRLLMNAKEYTKLLDAVNNPRLQLLQSEQTKLANSIVSTLARIGERTRTVGKEIARTQAPLLPKTAQVGGQAASRLASVFYPGISRPPTEGQ